ncbi:MAG TPA: tetratricopeptide repeat protein, partial [Planctomycetota bacterium]|nr:tetratricopeptide repeat protein [Planctomycetota bacterium]
GRADELLDALVEESTVRQQEARFRAQRGDELFGNNDFEGAEKEYEAALALNPLLDGARRKLHTAQVMLGKRSGEAEAIAQSIRDEEMVRRQQRLLEIQRNLTEGRQAFSESPLTEGALRRAEEKVSLAVDMIHVERDYRPADREAAEDLLRDIRAKKEDLETIRRQALMTETETRAQDELAREAKVRHGQVQELLRKSSEFLRQQDYDKAVEACQRVLELDPENRVAKFWLADAKDQILRERRGKVIHERLENTKTMYENFIESTIPQDRPFAFPDDEAWAQVTKRKLDFSSFGDEGDSESIRSIRNDLQVRVNLNWEDTPLDDVVQQLRTVTGAKILIDPQVNPKEVTVSGNYQELLASDVLDLVLESVGLGYVFKENLLFITSEEGLKEGEVEFSPYDVSDLLSRVRDFPGPELLLKPQGETQGSAPISFTSDATEEESRLDDSKLQELIVNSTGGEEIWTEPTTMEYHAGQLLVTASRDLHLEVQNVLANLRKDSDIFVVIEARFIDVNDDFLEDIGFDSRALGAVNNYGTPFGNVINDARTGGQDLGFVKQGSPVRDVTLIMGQDRWAGRVRHIIDGFTGAIRGERLTAGQGIGGLTLQSTLLEPFQINTILRAVQERSDVRQLTAPIVTAHNGQRVFASIITQRAYISDYNLVSGGTGFAIIEVADPEVQTFQEGVILDVDPVVSHDKKYVTLDVRPTLATLIGGVISTILISLGSFTSVAFQVPIGVPKIALQQSFTSVTVPNGGTVLLGGFKSLNDSKFKSYLPILGKIPLLGNLFRRKAHIIERRSLVILLTARIVDLRGEEARTYNAE